MRILKKAICIFTVMSIFCSAFCGISISAEEKDFSVVGKGSLKDSSNANGIALYDNYAYVSDGKTGLRVVDISSKSNPVDITGDEDTYKGSTYGGNSVSCVEDGFLYVCFGETSPEKKAGRGVRKYDLSDPAAPKYVRTYESGFRAYAVGVKDGYVFMADLQRGLKIFSPDSSEPIRTIYENAAISEVRGLYIYDDLLYLSYTKGIVVYNINNPLNVYIYSTYTNEELNNVTQICADENGVYFLGKSADGCGVVYILDLSDDKGDPAYIAQAPLVITSLDYTDLKTVNIRVKDGYLYVTAAGKLTLLDLDALPEIKQFRGFSDIAGYFNLTDEYIVGVNGSAICVMSTGEFGAGYKTYKNHYEYVDEVKNANYYRTNVTFSDIEDNWAKSDIEAMATLGIVGGTETGMFLPNEDTTFAAFISMILKVIGINPVEYMGAYHETSVDDWFSGDIQAASDIGLLNGMDISPNESVNRAEAAVVIKKALDYVSDKEIKYSYKKDVNDISKLDENTVAAILFSLDKGFMSTDKDKNFNPENKLTRADAAHIIKAVIDFADSKKLDRTKFRQAPIILRTSDAVGAGDAFNIYGDGFEPDNVHVMIEKVSSSEKSAEPGKDAVELKTVFSDEKGQYITAVFPKDAQGCAYLVWVKNSYGWSKPCYINKARTLWFSTEQTAADCDVYVNGRNFDCAEFGGNTATKVMLKGANGDYYVNQKTVTPYYVKFTVDSSVPAGDYDIYVSNDGILWDKSQSEQTLTVVEKTYDPYNLGVSWTTEFNWNNKVNVKDFGAKGNGTDFDTQAIYDAISSVWEKGGVVYFPEGTYITGEIKLPGHVILAGDGMDKTKILYKPERDKSGADIKADGVIYSDWNRCGEEGRQGIVNLTVDFARDENGNSYHPSKLPGSFVWLGGKWNTRDVPKRTAAYIFMKNCRFGSHSMDYTKETEEHIDEYLQRQTTVYVLADKYVLFDDNVIEADCGAFKGYYNAYVYGRNNRTNVLAGSFYNHAMYSIYENNYLENTLWEYGKSVKYSRQGIYFKTHSLVANNTVQNSACLRADGEVFATEAYQSGNEIIGNVVSSGTSSVKVEGYKNSMGYELRGNIGYGNWNTSQRAYGKGNIWRIIIVEGRGLGQVRNIVSSDKDTHIIQVDKPWTVRPDSTSKFTVYMPEDENTVYKNAAYDTGWGYLSYGNTTDTVYADNIGKNTTGLQFFSTLITKHSDLDESSWNDRAWNQFFCRSVRNDFRGASWKSKLVAIELTVSMNDTYNPHGYYNYGTEIKDCTVQGEGLTPKQILDHWKTLDSQGGESVGEGHYSGIAIPCAPDGRGRNLKYYDKKGAQAIIIQNNHLKDLDRGITLGGLGYYREEYRDECTNVDQCNTNGVVIKGNTFENVTTPYCRYGDTGTVILNDDGEVVEKS